MFTMFLKTFPLYYWVNSHLHQVAARQRTLVLVLKNEFLKITINRSELDNCITCTSLSCCLINLAHVLRIDDVGKCQAVCDRWILSTFIWPETFPMASVIKVNRRKKNQKRNQTKETNAQNLLHYFHNVSSIASEFNFTLDYTSSYSYFGVSSLEASFMLCKMGLCIVPAPFTSGS